MLVKWAPEDNVGPSNTDFHTNNFMSVLGLRHVYNCIAPISPFPRCRVIGLHIRTRMVAHPSDPFAAADSLNHSHGKSCCLLGRDQSGCYIIGPHSRDHPDGIWTSWG